MLAWLPCKFSGDPDQYCNINSIFCDFKWGSGPPPPPLDPPMVLTLFQIANTEIDTQTVTRTFKGFSRACRWGPALNCLLGFDVVSDCKYGDRYTDCNSFLCTTYSDNKRLNGCCETCSGVTTPSPTWTTTPTVPIPTRTGIYTSVVFTGGGSQTTTRTSSSSSSPTPSGNGANSM